MRRWLDRMLSERARLFLLSLAIAVTMWYYVGNALQPPEGRTPTASLRLHNVAVSVAGLADGWSATAEPDVVDVEVRWPATAVLSVRPTDVRAIADLGTLEPGTHMVPLRIQVPVGITVVKALPPAVLVRIARP